MAQLTPEIAGDTRYSTLGLRLSPKALDVMVYNPLEDNSLIVETFAIDSADRRKSLEEIVYDNPLLLGEFAKRRIIVETPDFTIVPAAVTDQDTLQALLRAARPEAETDCEMIVDEIAPLGAKLLSFIPLKEMNFLRRTFDNAPVAHSLAPLARYFAAQVPKGSAVRAYINLRDESSDLIILGADRLLLANRFVCSNLDDLAYYTVAAIKRLCEQPPEIIIAGQRSRREELLGKLRNFFPSVMPMIFPSAMYRAGKNAINAPFDLAIIPLCE